MSNSTDVHVKTHWRRGLTNGSTETDFPTLAATATKPATVDSATPTANLVVGGCGLNGTHFMFFGTDAANETAHARITLWREFRDVPSTVGAGTAGTLLWVPYVVGTFELTLGTLTGVSGGAITDSEFIADTITEVGTTWDDNLVTVKSPADNVMALVRINTVGFDLFQVDFDLDAATGPGASINVAYAHGP